MGSLHWTEDQLAEFHRRKAELDARGTVRTHRVKDDDEVKFTNKTTAEAKAESRARYNAKRRAIAAAKRPVKEPRKPKEPARKASVNTVGVMTLLRQIEAQALPTPILEHRFHPERKWRFDAAWPDRKIGLEVDGAIWVQGRHNRGDGMEKDNEKLNAAQILGWTVLRYSIGQVRKGMAIKDLRAVVGEGMA